MPAKKKIETTQPSRSDAQTCSARPKKPRCGNCAHGGKPWKLSYGGTQLHCEHPDKDVADIPPQGLGWGTLRNWYDTCEHWCPKMSLPNDKILLP